MKKLIVILLALVMVLGMAACAQQAAETQPTESAPPPTLVPYEPTAKSIIVLVPAAEEGWDALAAEAAVAKAEELKAAGVDVTVRTYADAQEQIKILEEIAAASTGDGAQGVVLMPAAPEVADALQKLLDANVAYALAEYIPESAAAASVANVSYDHRQFGAAAAAYLVSAGMTQKNDVVVLEGVSDEDALKTEGFKLYLQGKMAVNGAYIETPWDNLATIVYSELEGATREGAQTYFETYMEDGDRAWTGYFAAWDDIYILGMLDALEGDAISSRNRGRLFDMEPTVTGFGASEYLCGLLKADAEESDEEPEFTYLGDFDDINTMVYDHTMLAQALQSMADYMAGEVVEQTQLLTVQWAFAPEASTEETE